MAPAGVIVTVRTIISGGQTGADQGALCAGHLLGLETGGWAPRGWRTDDGPCPDLSAFGLVEAPSSDYAGRTHMNVRASDATIVFGDSGSPGSKLTMSLCKHERKPVTCIPWRADVAVGQEWEMARQLLVDLIPAWCAAHGVHVLNVAGNRERVNPGIGRACCDFLVEALGVRRTP